MAAAEYVSIQEWAAFIRKIEEKHGQDAECRFHRNYGFLIVRDNTGKTTYYALDGLREV